MNMKKKSAGSSESGKPWEEIHEYAQGELRARSGKVNGWLLVVYIALFVWAIYYGFTYWGGLGPGLNY